MLTKPRFEELYESTCKELKDLKESLYDVSECLNIARYYLEHATNATPQAQGLLAKVGEAEILRRGMLLDALPKGATVPVVFVKEDITDGIKRLVVKIENEARRLIMDPDFGYMWYNAEGPEE